MRAECGWMDGCGCCGCCVGEVSDQKNTPNGFAYVIYIRIML